MKTSGRPGFARALLEFYDRTRRDLPWRHRPEPYRTLVSELMLQQTGVSTVVPYFERFVARFPTLRALAEAEEEEVLASWSGLGYYTRARNLHRTARLVMERHAGRLPATEAELRSLPGLGPYTAAAVAAIAFGVRTLAVDGNVARVLARLHAVADPIDDPAVRQRLRSQSEALAPRQRCGDFVQAMMELGALVCVPNQPGCQRCPVSRFCEAHQRGVQGELPRRTVRPAKRKVMLVCAAVERDGRVLLVRRPPRTLLGGTWTLPSEEVASSHDAGDAVIRALAPLGLAAEGAGEPMGSIRHVFTHRDVTAEVVRQPARGQASAAARWVDPGAMDDLPLSTFTRKTLSLLGG